MHEGGGNCLKYLQRGATEKRVGETKILKMVSKLVQGVNALKRGRGGGGGGTGAPLQIIGIFIPAVLGPRL